jgi:hypothetical protein
LLPKCWNGLSLGSDDHQSGGELSSSSMPTRRDALKYLGAGAILVGCQGARSGPRPAAITNIRPLGPGVEPWWTPDPFLFCVHHDDQYPASNGAYGPNASLAGHEPGQDFAGVDGWRMYHGDHVPGFPVHPHRGFETVTVVRQGLLDHWTRSARRRATAAATCSG